MSRLIKMDLHTHPIEALREKMGIKGIRDINQEVASLIVEAVKASGLDGIAITERNNFNHGWVAALEIKDNFRHESLVILPGVEIDYAGQHFLQIYVPNYVRRRIPFFLGKEWFLILAHPGYYNLVDIEELDRVAFDAVEEKSLYGEFPLANQIARRKNILTSVSSTAHKLDELGRLYMELEITSK